MSVKCVASNLNLQIYLWDKNTEERIKTSSCKKQNYFVNAIDVARNIKQSMSLHFIYSLLIPKHSLKVKMLGCIFINILPCV